MTKLHYTLRSGFTTGACAQAAAKAAAAMLLKQEPLDAIDVILPNGTEQVFAVSDQVVTFDAARCSVIKDAGDDKDDITDGIAIVAEVRRDDGDGIRLRGGDGVGTVTGPGLPVAIGEPAINPVPRKMILRDVSEILDDEAGYVVEISVPQGKELAEKTQNPRLGIVGGVSIIGTRGIVEPKSMQAYTRSLSVALNVAYENGHRTLCIASGYISERVLKEVYAVPDQAIITVGDHFGFILQECERKGIQKIILVGHIGKLVKIAAGIFNTHWSSGDARMETIAAYAARNGASQQVVAEILACSLAEATIAVLQQHELMHTFTDIAEAVVRRAMKYTHDAIEIRALVLALSGDCIGSYPPDLERKEIWDMCIS